MRGSPRTHPWTSIIATGGRFRWKRSFRGGPPAYVLAVAVLFVVGVGAADSMIGPDVSIAPFYVLPILIATWNLGRAWGFLVAGLAAVAMQLADVRSVETNVLVPSWNALVWYAVFLFVVWLLAIIRDHAKRQRSQLESQEEVSDDLRAQNDMKNTLLHAVSHDLKGPLAGILGAMQTIRRADQLKLTGVELNDLYGVIEQAGRKASRLVDDLLDLDRLRRGQLQPEREPTDVGELADRLALELPSLSGHPVRIESEPLLVDVDRAKVERIVENLLNNAARHTPAGPPCRWSSPNGTRGWSSSSRTRAQGCPTTSRTRSSNPSAKVRAHVAAWASVCRSCSGSPSCMAGRPGSKTGRGAALASW
jgi:Osmosensitive K+ channel histidine kinase